MLKRSALKSRAVVAETLGLGFNGSRPSRPVSRPSEPQRFGRSFCCMVSVLAFLLVIFTAGTCLQLYEGTSRSGECVFAGITGAEEAPAVPQSAAHPMILPGGTSPVHSDLPLQTDTRSSITRTSIFLRPALLDLFRQTGTQSSVSTTIVFLRPRIFVRMPWTSLQTHCFWPLRHSNDMGSIWRQPFCKTTDRSMFCILHAICCLTGSAFCFSRKCNPATRAFVGRRGWQPLLLIVVCFWSALAIVTMLISYMCAFTGAPNDAQALCGASVRPERTLVSGCGASTPPVSQPVRLESVGPDSSWQWSGACWYGSQRSPCFWSVSSGILRLSVIRGRGLCARCNRRLSFARTNLLLHILVLFVAFVTLALPNAICFDTQQLLLRFETFGTSGVTIKCFEERMIFMSLVWILGRNTTALRIGKPHSF